MTYEKFIELDKKFEKTGHLSKEETALLFAHVGQLHVVLKNYLYTVEKIFHLSGSMCQYEDGQEVDSLT